MRRNTMLSALVPMTLLVAWGGRADHTDLILSDADLTWLSSAGCQECSPCNELKHQLTPSPYPWNGRVAEHDCAIGDCFDHLPCGPDIADAAALQDATSTIHAIRRADPAELKALVAAYPHLLRINHRRQALQLVGCGSAVVASYGIASIPSLGTLLD